MARQSRHVQGEFEELDRFIDRCCAALGIIYAGATVDQPSQDPDASYARSVRSGVRLLTILLAAAQMPLQRAAAPSIKAAADAVHRAAARTNARLPRSFEESCRAARDSSGLDIFDPDSAPIPGASFGEIAQVLLRPRDNSTIDPLFFQTTPLWWLGCAYQAMLSMRPSSQPGRLRADPGRRKRRGVYFTPPCLVDYVTNCVLGPMVDSRLGRLDGPDGEGVLDLRIVDPAMGGGGFLGRAVEFLGETTPGRDQRAAIAADCVYGVDIDPVAVDIARFTVWAASDFADGISDSIVSHLICADALTGDLPFPSPAPGPRPLAPAFDAVVGNPPYIASKNRLLRPHGRGQSDSYLLFLAAVVERELVRTGGTLSMVLPDPMLVRENAARVRCKLAADWTIESIVHILGAFPDAVVANIVPVFRNTPPTSETFPVARIERAGDRRSFVLDPCKIARDLARPVRRQTVLAQKRCEFLYLLEEGPFAGVLRRIHGSDLSLANYQPPFAPLRELNVRAVYRGEEIGKSAITGGDGDLPMLLGGQSVQPYEITWEGHTIDRSRVRKALARYQRTKVLIQKSAGRVIAALDEVRRRHRGYVFPQSVYAVELEPDGIHHLYLLCILNSEVINEYIHRTVTAYKMVQPQLEIEDIRALPIRRISFTTPAGRRRAEVARGVGMFEDECLRSGENMHFPELAGFVGRCLTANPEMSDVVHDLLVHLGRLAVDLSRRSRRSPDAAVTHNLECVRAAIEALVWRLYSTEPAQMALAM